MSNRLVLVDSSAWVQYFTERATPVSQAVRTLVTANRVAINPVIGVELLTGAQDDLHYAQLVDILRGFHLLPISEVIWERTQRLRFALCKRGYLLPIPDVVIACCALANECELLHADRHFDFIASATALRIYPRS